MTQLIALVRHGEVYNPDHVVYADLEGFALSERGWDQAASCGERLAALGVTDVVTSPLQRAVETGNAVAAHCQTNPTTDNRLTEWLLGTRWAGTVWEDLPQAFPGELEAYLAHPTDLPFSPESIADVAERMETVVADYMSSDGTVVFVSHQDPVQAARLHLTGRSLTELHTSKPGHGSIVVLEHDGTMWVEREYWEPDQGHVFPPRKHTPSDSP